MKLRVVDIDLFLDYKLRQNKGARGQPLPFVKYLGRFNTPKGAAMRNERNAMKWPIGLAAITVFYDLLLYSTGCKERGVLADSDGGFTMEWLQGTCKCPVDVLPEVIQLLIRYGWLADDDGEIQPSMATSKVVSMPTKPQDVSATPWGEVAERLIAIWRTKGPTDRLSGPAHVEELLMRKYGERYELGALILYNAERYQTSHPKYCQKLANWIEQDSGTVPRESKEAARETGSELVSEEDLAAWEAEMQQQYQAGQVSKEAMQSWGLL